MNAYTFIKRTDVNLRNAIYKAYNKKCFYCGEKINMHQLEIDHIIPTIDKDISNNSELQEYLKELKDKNFIKDCIANYLPSCRHCNNQKNSKSFTVGNLRFFHEQSLRHTDKVIEYMEQFIYADKNFGKKRAIKKLSEDYLIDKTILESPYDCFYTYGLGEVRVNAFLPVSIEKELTCLILFKQEGLSDCMFSLEEDSIRSIFFDGYKTGVDTNRNFIWYIDCDDVGIKLLDNRFISNFKTAEQLSLIFDDLYEEFRRRKSALLNIIGATNFEEIDKGEFAILRIPKNIWFTMVNFAQVHDYFTSDTSWDIFSPLNTLKKNRIVIYKNHLDKNNADILAELYVKDISDNYFDIIWKAGYTPSLTMMEGFNNNIKWKTDYTHDWLLNKFIPYIIYANIPDSRNIFQRIYKKKITFEEFKKSFNHFEFNIESLSFKN